MWKDKRFLFEIRIKGTFFKEGHMNNEEILELAEKVAPTTKLSINEVANIISEIINIQNSGLEIKFDIDEEYIQKVIWAKTVMGRL